MFSSQVALFRQRYAALVAHHDMVQGSYPDQVQGLPQFVGQGEIRLAGFGIPGGMVVHQDYGCGVLLQGCLDDLAWIDAGAIERAPEHFLEVDDSMAAVEQEEGKNLMLVIGQQRL